VNGSTLQPTSGILASLIVAAAVTMAPPLISGDMNAAAAPAAGPHKVGMAARAHKNGAALSPQKAAMAELFLSFNR